MTMMKKLWTEALELVRQGGVQTVTLKYVGPNGALIETTTGIENLSDDSLEQGIQLHNGPIVYPNPTTAVLNPFLANPIISFLCDVQKGPSSPQVSDQYESINTSPVEIQLSSPKQSPRRITSTTSTTESSDHRGTSCHQCKNARSLDHLAFCSNLFNKRTSVDMRHCRKKFCQGCLSKFYGDSIENSRRSGWICPSCRGNCKCAACTRKRRKSANAEEVPQFPKLVKGECVLANDRETHVQQFPELMQGLLLPCTSGGGDTVLPDEQVVEESGIVLPLRYTGDDGDISCKLPVDRTESFPSH